MMDMNDDDNGGNLEERVHRGLLRESSIVIDSA